MKSNLSSPTIRGAAVLSATALLTLLSIGNLHAVVVTASSSGSGVVAGAQLLGLINVNPAPIASDSHSGIAPFSGITSALDANANIGALGINALATQGVFGTNQQSTVDGGAGSRLVSSVTTVTGTGGNPFSVQVADLPLLSPLISISATVIQTTATLSGDYGSLTASGSTTLANLGISINGGATLSLADLVSGLGLIDGTDINLATGLILRPNVTILGVNLGNLAGVDLVLNKQVEVINGQGERSLEVTALALTLDGVTIGAFNGLDVDLGVAPSSVQLSAVPEPTSLLLGGFSLLGLAIRRRRSC